MFLQYNDNCCSTYVKEGGKFQNSFGTNEVVALGDFAIKQFNILPFLEEDYREDNILLRRIYICLLYADL